MTMRTDVIMHYEVLCQRHMQLYDGLSSDLNPRTGTARVGIATAGVEIGFSIPGLILSFASRMRRSADELYTGGSDARGSRCSE